MFDEMDKCMECRKNPSLLDISVAKKITCHKHWHQSILLQKPAGDKGIANVPPLLIRKGREERPRRGRSDLAHHRQGFLDARVPVQPGVRVGRLVQRIHQLVDLSRLSRIPRGSRLIQPDDQLGGKAGVSDQGSVRTDTEIA